MAVRPVRPLATLSALVSCVVIVPSSPMSAQAIPPQWQGVPRVEIPDVTLLHTADEPDILVRVLARGLSHPWSMAFLPNGDMLVTERAGRLRVIRDGVLDSIPVAGVPEVNGGGGLTGLMEVALHPDFAQNREIYLTYTTAAEQSRIALARARFDGYALQDLRVVFESEGRPIGISGSRLLFAPDGTLFMPLGGAFNAGTTGLRAQDPNDQGGKILRLRDDGTVPSDNPFVGRCRLIVTY
jgi:glucose/arabinose dehydrogenase